MPKIIQNPEKRLIEEAIRQIEEVGYSGMTIRSVAKACGVGVGTVYNYFLSKDDLLAKYLLDDWSDCVKMINAVSEYSESARSVARCICDQLNRYTHRHERIFRDETAAASFAGSFGRYHALLRSQLSAPLRKFCENNFTAEFIAEALLTWTMAGKTFEEIYSIIENLLI